MFRTNLKKILFLLPLIVVVISYVMLQTTPLVIVSREKGFDSARFQLRVYTDKEQGGHSSIELLDTTKTLSYHYLLDNTVAGPIARVFIASSQKKSIPLSSYNTLCITVHSKQVKPIPILFCNPVDLHATPQEIRTYHLAVHYAATGLFPKTQALAFKDFATPDWWYAFESNQQFQTTDQDFTQAQYVVLSNSAFIGNRNEDTVVISDLRFVYDFTGFFIWSSVLVALYYLLYVLFFYFPKSLGVETIYLLYKKIDTVNYEEADKQSLLSTLQQHFKNPELSISTLQKETGIHERKISVLIKKYTGLSLKQYINQLRIEHAKKLLVETNLTVSDIAYESGYNNVSHFNRVFKTEESCSPLEYRLSKTSAIS